MERLSLVSFPCLLLQLSATRQTYAQASATFRVHAEMTVLLFCQLLRRANPPAQGKRRGTFIKKKGGWLIYPYSKKPLQPMKRFVFGFFCSTSLIVYTVDSSAQLFKKPSAVSTESFFAFFSLFLSSLVHKPTTRSTASAHGKITRIIF